MVPVASGASPPSAGTRESLASTSSVLTPICDEVGERAMQQQRRSYTGVRLLGPRPQDLDLRHCIMGSSHPILLSHDVTCSFHGHGPASIELLGLDMCPGDFCSRCPIPVSEDCDEITCATIIIDRAADPALLPQFLSSRFEFVRKLAINKLEELQARS